MKRLGRMLGGLGFVAFTALFGVACMAPVDPEPEDIMSDGDDEAFGEENVSEVAEAIGSCHGLVACPNPASCAAWSSPYTCGTICGNSRECGGCGPLNEDPFCVPDGTKGLREVYERFRTCTLQNGSSCTEYTITTGLVIDCGCTP
jgi:hypothetical protein